MCKTALTLTLSRLPSMLCEIPWKLCARFQFYAKFQCDTIITRANILQMRMFFSFTAATVNSICRCAIDFVFEQFYLWNSNPDNHMCNNLSLVNTKTERCARLVLLLLSLKTCCIAFNYVIDCNYVWAYRSISFIKIDVYRFHSTNTQKHSVYID